MLYKKKRTKNCNPDIIVDVQDHVDDADFINIIKKLPIILRK